MGSEVRSGCNSFGNCRIVWFTVICMGLEFVAPVLERVVINLSGGPWPFRDLRMALDEWSVVVINSTFTL